MFSSAVFIGFQLRKPYVCVGFFADTIETLSTAATSRRRLRFIKLKTTLGKREEIINFSDGGLYHTFERIYFYCKVKQAS